MDIADVMKRVDDLEKRVQRQRMLIIGMCLAATAAVVMAAAPQSQEAEFDSISARTLYIDNEAGETVAALSARENGALLYLKNSADKVIASISTSSKNGGMLQLRNDDKVSVSLHANENGGDLRLLDKSEKEVVTIFADADGEGYVGVWNQKGKGKTLEP